eukprot:CAMPEP_0202002574 /NCGR_PEP_ID=MMETSP0905-20130828/8378_1 /ASSEMBLY_ACC=CAM_ASM_000554 /TAXON_ID=420261 /ORGANISM="Thalassiosira antarctica, Strain CCMP982" /LENGTH=66 /DNA_ID=CAMNT_0048559503 /DNA_START=5 /DNA_END=202 /DNA_ORIENTATION=+
MSGMELLLRAAECSDGVSSTDSAASSTTDHKHILLHSNFVTTADKSLHPNEISRTNNDFKSSLPPK